MNDDIFTEFDFEYLKWEQKKVEASARHNAQNRRQRDELAAGIEEFKKSRAGKRTHETGGRGQL